MAAGVEIGQHPASAASARGARTGRIVQLLIAYLALGIGSLWALFPFLWMISTSLKSDSQVLIYPPAWVPAPAVWGNYQAVLKLVPFGQFLVNTTIVAVTVTILELITSSFAAYAFARLRFPGRDKLFLLYLGTLMIPGQVTIIPNFLVMSWLGWVDTYAALIIPAAFSAFGTFLLRQFFLTIPPELEQAARMDGCSYFGIYRHIILPLSGPALATLAVFGFMTQWNAFLWPLIVTNKETMRTLTVGIRYFGDEAAGQFNYLMAGTVMSIIPILILFLLLQRYFVRGIALTGMGGR
ncbi:MAG TPA: carbohydrate ABC transporter permease [Chloroflexota bacterium]|nr:carbohydrate ABC transporter permease [Chloroflexota bacterium]